MRVLIVRLSSMGDIVLTFPALTDAMKAIPGIRFDWAVDQSFAQVPSWHPGVEKVIISSHRKWRKNLLPSLKSGLIKEFISELRSTSYDLIIDVQTEWKSAIVTRLARGLRCGYDSNSVHEWGAQFAYQKQSYVPKGQHVLHRMRMLLAQTLGYNYENTDPDYSIDLNRLSKPLLELPKPYLVFIFGTSWSSKCWPEEYWKSLVQKAKRANFNVVLPWGNAQEHERAKRIAHGQENALVLPDMNLSQKAYIIKNAHATIGCDTGLSHIAAALNVPSLSLYGATDPSMTGVIGKQQILMTSNFECLNCHRSVCNYKKLTEVKPACFSELSPEIVWQRFQGSVLS